MRAIVPASMPAEKSALLRAFGAEVVPTPTLGADGRHPMDVAMDMAEQTLEASDDFVMPNQYDNPDNSRAHYETTGPEIWAQTEGRVRLLLRRPGHRRDHQRSRPLPQGARPEHQDHRHRAGRRAQDQRPQEHGMRPPSPRSSTAA